MFRKKTSLYTAILAVSSTLPMLTYAQNDAGWQGLEEIVVTAQFVEQNLQDTPVAITAMSGELMQARGQQSVEEISAQAPNVTLTQAGAFAGPALIGYIRGVGQADFNPAMEPGVGMYVDDVYYSTLTGSVLDLLDLDRLEVLRGPQGTLAGKNSIGGAIKLYSKKPDADNDGYVEVGYGSLNAHSIRAASNLTIVDDTLYARIAGVSRARDGHVTRLDYNCANPGSTLDFGSNILGADCDIGKEGGIKYTAARAALRWIASDNLEINFSADTLSDTSEPPANIMFAYGETRAPVFSGTTGLAWPFAAPFPQVDPSIFIRDDGYSNYATYTDDRTGSKIKPEQTMESRGYSLNVDWQLTDDLQLQSITGYRRYDAAWGTDPDGSPFAVQQLYQQLDHTQKSQEFRLNGKAGDFLDYTVGAFYFDATTIMDARVNLGYVGFDFIHGPDPVDSTTWALFGQTMMHFTDDLTLAVGIRYTDDQKDYTFARRNADLSEIEPCLGPPGTAGNPPNCLISSLNGVSNTFDDTRTDYRVALSYNFTEDFMGYAQYSTGFKGGGINPRPFYNVQAVTFNPEELEAIELGVKAEVLDSRLRMNAAVFFNEYTDIQLQLNECSAIFGPIFGNPCLALQNAGDADVQGAEFEFDLLLGQGFTLDGSISYLDFEYTEINPTTGINKDNITPFTPEVSGSLGLQYELRMDSGTFIPRIDFAYQDEMFTAADNTELGKIDSRTLVNANLTWLSKEEDWQVSLVARNLTDKYYFTSKTDALPGFGGSAYGSPALPRTYTLTVKRTF